MLQAAIHMIPFLISFTATSTLFQGTMKAEDQINNSEKQITMQRESIEPQVSSAPQYEINVDSISEH